MTKPILLVEDNPHDLEFALLALEKCSLPHPVAVARDGEEALDYLLSRNDYAGREAEEPALVLLNLKMPKVSGVEVLRTMRETKRLASIPVVVMGDPGVSEDIRNKSLPGVNHYIVKPLDLKLFIAEVCKATSAYAGE